MVLTARVPIHYSSEQDGVAALLRSEHMTHFKLYIPMEIAQQTVAELGDLGIVELTDLNPDVNAFQRAFVNEIRRLDEMERKLRFLQGQMEKVNIPAKKLSSPIHYARTRSQVEIDQMEERLIEHESRLLQMNNSQETLNKRYLELSELRHVLRETAVFFDAAEGRVRHGVDEPVLTTRDDAGLLSHAAPHPITEEDDDQGRMFDRTEGGLRAVSLGFVTGVIPRSRMGIFERILFRALRGNLYMNVAEIDETIKDPITEEEVRKNVFIIFAHGKELIAKIRKICESLGATLYPVDEAAEKRRTDAMEVLSRIEDLKQVLNNTAAARKAELSRVADMAEIWSNILLREKAIYYTMNMFNGDPTKHSLIAEGWCPTSAIPSIRYSLSGLAERTGSTVAPIFNEHPTTKTPPTHHKTNKFTQGFQSIVDAYGMATYREVNPGIFTVITFPFLFAVMFGDFGHGLIMSLFALWMVTSESKLATKDWGEIWRMFFGGRYIILLMGLFSVYTGLMYNDVFSKAFDIFGSGWEFKEKIVHNTTVFEAEFTKVYPFGMDPAWHKSDNFLVFSNSYKMKMAIIFGVMQMSFGIALNVLNYIHFNKRISIYTEFIPQITFLMSIFGYLVILILCKWVAGPAWEQKGLLNTLIYMFLSPRFYIDTNKDGLYAGQGAIQVLLVLIAFCCIPVMLGAKPYMEWKEHNKARALGYDNVADRASMDSSGRPGSPVATPHEMDHEEHFDFGEIMVHQVIHTIEFCLGAISNTASYLRLWALSLAHAQLSEVLWEMVMDSVLTMKGSLQFVYIFIAFGFWFILTVAILITMEGLSAFLHALRLHWVEFQNKFYGGAGRKFMPFSFAKLADKDEE